MDLAEKKESKGSAEDDRDSPERDGGDDDSTASARGQFYNCTFCKRGFSTAQALGGHMNIHRKERARTTSSRQNVASSVAPESVEGSGSSGGYYHPPSSQSVRVHSAYSQRPRELSLFGGSNLSLGLGMHGGGDEEEEEEKKDDEEKKEVDLELRLGHDP